MFKSNAVRSCVELHEIELRRFCDVWETFRASGTPLPETDDPSYQSAEHLGGHVFRSARNYLTWIGEFVNRPVTDVDSDTDAASIARKGRVFVDEVLAAWRRHLALLEDRGAGAGHPQVPLGRRLQHRADARARRGAPDEAPHPAGAADVGTGYSSPLMRSLRALAIYAVLTVAFTWPFAANLRVMDAGDSAFFAWEIGWTVHALKTDPAQLPHANIFHPLRYTLGMDEPVLGTTVLVLPLAALHRRRSAALQRRAAADVPALGAHRLLARPRAGGGGVGGAPGGALFAFSPIRTDQVAHLSTLGTQWLPLVVLFAVRFARSGKTRDALLAGLFFVLSFTACGYHGVIALAVLPPAFLPLLWGRWRLLPKAVLATALAGALLLPLYLMHRAALAPERYARGTEETILYSASLESFLSTSAWNRVYGEATDAFRTIGPNNLFPGLVVPGLAIAGAVALRRQKRRPSREAVALGVMLLAAALVALGPRIRAFGLDLMPGPWALLRELVPVFQNIRVTSRAGAFLALPLAMLAAMALTRLRPKPAALAGIGALALAETLIAPIPMPQWSKLIDTRQDPPPVYRWIADQPGRDPIVHLPMLDVYGLERRPAFHESVYMVYSTLHWKPLVNGYAGIEPRRYVEIRSLARAFPSGEFLDALRAIGTRYVIVHRKGYGPFQWERLQKGMPPALASGALREVARLGNDTVYELGPAGSEERAADPSSPD